MGFEEDRNLGILFEQVFVKSLKWASDVRFWVGTDPKIARKSPRWVVNICHVNKKNIKIAFLINYLTNI